MAIKTEREREFLPVEIAMCCERTGFILFLCCTKNSNSDISQETKELCCYDKLLVMCLHFAVEVYDPKAHTCSWVVNSVEITQ